MKAVQHFILGIQFLTRIPLTKASVPCEPSDFKGAMSFFALIGAIIGLIQWGVYQIGTWLMGPLMGAVLGTLAGVWATGGLHLDGLSDLFDGLGANQSKERTLEIMKDSRVGAFGVIAIVMDLMLHVVGFYSLREAPYLYIWIPVCAKMGVCFLCFIGQSLSKGMGSLWIGNIGCLRLVLNILVAVVIGWLVGGSVVMLFGILLSLGVAGLVKWQMHKRLGGINGDILGACNQFIEWSMICYCISVLTHGVR